MSDALQVGDGIRLSGGYEMTPQLLAGGDGYFGVVTGFIPGQDESPAVVVKLEKKIEFRDTVADIAVLELRYKGAAWSSTGTVHVELCNFEPEVLAWKSRKQGLWVESHATYIKLK